MSFYIIFLQESLTTFGTLEKSVPGFESSSPESETLNISLWGQESTSSSTSVGQRRAGRVKKSKVMNKLFVLRNTGVNSMINRGTISDLLHSIKETVSDTEHRVSDNCSNTYKLCTAHKLHLELTFSRLVLNSLDSIKHSKICMYFAQRLSSLKNGQ